MSPALSVVAVAEGKASLASATATVGAAAGARETHPASRTKQRTTIEAILVPLIDEDLSMSCSPKHAIRCR
jgi:hypothetical protein